MIADIAGVKTRYEKGGSGPPVLVLHGWGSSVEGVRPMLHGLSLGQTVIAVDLPGFGQAEPPPDHWGTYDYAAWVGAFMDVIQCPQAHLIGHSFGGRIAIVLAAKYPHRVNRLVLVDSAGIIPSRGRDYQARVQLFKTARRLAGWIPVDSWRDSALDQVRAAFGSVDYQAAGALRSVFVRVVNEDLRPLLPDIKANTLLVWGENDRDVPVSDGQIMAREIPHSRLEVLPGAGHFSYMDRLPGFCRLVRDFLKEEH